MNSKIAEKILVRAAGSNGPELKENLRSQLILLSARLLTIAFARQSFFHAAFFAGLQIVGMPFDFLDDVLLLDFPFEPAQGVFKRFTLL